VTCATFVVFLLTLAPDVTWAYYGTDGGELITAAVTLGVPHPPGYPLYVLLGKLVSLIPVSESVAYRFNLFSALCMALSAGLLAAAVGRRRNACIAKMGITGLPHDLPLDISVLAPALFAGTCFAFLPLVWQQAVIAEVYALNMLAVGLSLWFITQPEPRAGLVGLALGLAMTTHLTSSILLLPALLAVRPSGWRRFAGGLASGLVPFLALPWLATRGSPVVWGWPDTLAGWWWQVSASIYRPNLFSLPAPNWAARVEGWLAEPTIWVALVLLAIVMQRRQRLAQKLGRLQWGLLAASGTYAVYAFAYDAPDSLVFILPALALLCFQAAMAIDSGKSLLLLLPLALLVINFQQIDLSEQTEARSLAESTLRDAPPDAIILTSGDRTTFTLWYLQHVEGQRRDLIVVDDNLLAFDWYRTRLSQAHPKLAGLDADDLAQFRRLNGARRPWCELRFDAERNVHFHCMGQPA
jgi:hypothetical protein